MTTTEQDRAQMEAERNAADSIYFSTRKLKGEQEFNDGYERGWNERNKKVMELQAEVARLNKWADGFSDAQMKERLTGELYQRELRARIDALESLYYDTLSRAEVQT